MASLSSLIHRKPIVLFETASLQEAARALAENHVGCILVCNSKGNPSGILTDRDLALHWASASPSPLEKISDVMSHDPVHADENVGLQEIIRLMELHGVRRIPIVHKTGKQTRFIGIVTLDDLIAAQLIPPGLLVQIVRRQVSRRLVKEAGRKTQAGVHPDAKDQTLQRYLNHIADSTGISEDLTPSLSHTILASLIMRMNMTGSTHFLAQLPERVRSPLLEIPPGPDKFITPHTITAELVDRFHFTEGYARTVLHRFLAALSAWMTPGQIEHLRAQLPESFLSLFEPMAPEAETEGAPHLSQITLTSPAFSDGSEIPRAFTADGFDRSPRLEWSKVPPKTREFALICEDPDVSREIPWLHWVIYGISSSTTQIPEGIPQVDTIPAPIRARQGRNSSGKLGYQGPMSSAPAIHGAKEGWHRYIFRLYALDHEIALAPGATADELRQAMKNHILAEGVLIGRYRRADRQTEGTAA